MKIERTDGNRYAIHLDKRKSRKRKSKSLNHSIFVFRIKIPPPSTLHFARPRDMFLRLSLSLQTRGIDIAQWSRRQEYFLYYFYIFLKCQRFFQIIHTSQTEYLTILIAFITRDSARAIIMRKPGNNGDFIILNRIPQIFNSIYLQYFKHFIIPPYTGFEATCGNDNCHTT